MNKTLPLSGRVEAARASLAENPSQMTVVIARQFDLPEHEVIQLLPTTQVRPLDPERWEGLIRDFEQLGSVHVIATNGAVTLEAFGQFGNFSFWGDYFNVQTKSLDMHIRFKEIQSIFAVEKPGHMDGVNTLSFQFFDRQGDSAFKVFLTFGGDAPPAEKVAAFNELRNRYAV